MSALRRIFPIREATPFASQAGTQASYSTGGVAGAAMGNTAPTKKMLEQAEDLLRRIMAAEENQALNRIINKFLVDITPYLEEQP